MKKPVGGDITQLDRYATHSKAARWGHTLGEFQKNGEVSIAVCKQCGERAILHEVPHPNGRSTGNALNWKCKETHGS